MEIINRRVRMMSVARKLRREEEKTIGLVPTMGALHEGHLSLVREARRMSDIVVVSIFVNPAQFAPNEDFTKYPRALTRDTTLLADYNVDYIFAPAVEEIYSKNFSTYVSVEGATAETMEGAARPGHFRGVATVVAVLLNVVRPDFTFFGQKDAQQAVVIKRMVRDLAFDTEIIVLPTMREPSGLAMSSRNAYLDADEHQAATVLYQALRAAKLLYKDGERSAKRLAEAVRQTIEREPRARLDYVNISDADTLERLDKLDDRTALVAIAAHIGNTRLIDNVILQPPAREKIGTTGEL